MFALAFWAQSYYSTTKIAGLAVVGTSRKRVRGHGSNTAVVVTVARHPDVAVHAPRGTPRVLDDPVIRAARRAITYSQDTVVKLSGAAVGSVVDTAGVELERVVGSIDGNRDWADGGYSNLKSRFGTRLNILVSSEGRTAVGSVVLASTILSGVRVAGFSVNSVVVDDVLESIIHQTTVTSVVAFSLRAVNQVLLGETDKLTSVQSMSTFQGTGGRERPARAALALVLDTSNNALGPPIYRRGERNSVQDFRLRGNADFYLLQTLVESVEFLVGEIGELVHSDGEAEALLVEFLNKLVVVLPDLPPVLELLVEVDFVVRPHPLDEFALHGQIRGRACIAASEECYH